MHKAANDNSGSDVRPKGKAARSCPICGKPVTIEANPFCSNRCADVDLHRWLAEGYRAPAGPDDDGSEVERES